MTSVLILDMARTFSQIAFVLQTIGKRQKRLCDGLCMTILPLYKTFLKTSRKCRGHDELAFLPRKHWRVLRCRLLNKAMSARTWTTYLYPIFLSECRFACCICSRIASGQRPRQSSKKSMAEVYNAVEQQDKVVLIFRGSQEVVQHIS